MTKFKVKNWTEQEYVLLRERFSEEGPYELMKELGRSYGSVTKKASELGLSSRASGGRRAALTAIKRSGINADYFDKWSKEMVYVLGYIWADGSVCSSLKSGQPNTLRLCCSSKDEEIILFIRDQLNSKHSLCRRSESLRKNGKIRRAETSCVIAGLPMIQGLIRKGVLPNKTYLDLEFPEIPEEFQSSFCLGNFDGDGCFSKGVYSWNGSRKFIEGLQKVISNGAKVPLENKILNTKSLICWKIAWANSHDVKSIYEWLYGGATFFLKRKEEKAREYIEVKKEAGVFERKPRRFWTDSQKEEVQKRYPVEGTKNMAIEWGVSSQYIEYIAHSIGIKKIWRGSS